MKHPFRPDLESRDFLSIPFGRLGVRGLVIDVDGTLRPDGGEFPARILARLAGLGKRYRLVLLSNCSKKKAWHAMERTGLPLVRARKPLAGGFRKAFKILGLKPEETAVVGDRRFADILGGNLAGAKTVFVKSSFGDSRLTRLGKLVLDRPLRWLS